MTTAEQQTETPPEPDKQEEPQAATGPKFRTSMLVEADDFRAFIRLPNQWQHDEIRRKALAAKARRVRQLRDPETDAYVVLDADMEALERSGDREAMIAEIVGKEWWRDHLEAVRDVQEEERFEHIDDDQRRFSALLDMPEEERPADEYGELDRTILAYNEVVGAKREERQQPRRDALADTDITDLIAMIREQRVEAEAGMVFNLIFTKWEIAACTFKLDADGKPTADHYFEGVEAVEKAPPEIVDRLQDAFGELEGQFGRGAVGNS